jgi:aminopeptidase
MDIRIERMARLLAEYSVDVQPGDRVAIATTPAASELVLALYEQILLRGGHPVLNLKLPGLEEIFYRVADEAQLDFVDPLYEQAINTFEAFIRIRAETNTRELTAIDPAQQTRHNRAMKPVMQRFMERGYSGGPLKWCSTLFPTRAYAQEADMSLRDYQDFVFGACFCDEERPVDAWQKIHEEQERVIQWLKGRDRVKVVGPNVDLTLSIKDRVFVNSDGHHNMPSGEVFTGPVEDSADGWVRFTYPAVTSGREVEGIELHFEEGKVVAASAAKNEPYLHQMLETDAGARYLGEFAIGTNFGIQQFTKNILFDEKIGGSFHMALGAGYPETGSQNESAIHWDMICDMRNGDMRNGDMRNGAAPHGDAGDGGEIWVDGDLLYKDGAFVI